MSFSIIILDHQKSTLQVTNAGHPFSYLIRQGVTRELQNNGPAFGFQPDFPYQSETMKIQSGDNLVMFTDGLIESAESRKMLNLETIKKTLSLIKLGKEPARNVMDSLLGIQKNGQLRDDATIITVKKY